MRTEHIRDEKRAQKARCHVMHAPTPQKKKHHTFLDVNIFPIRMDIHILSHTVRVARWEEVERDVY